ncbi:hypothetical protein VTL71DRAFT_15780 [Oculimacula yallundae]|uniref:Uncharacterized protein n=1 Tax=Oculimacula yallundae TaxID=86028 RepID=A0ABR4CEV7_9HELO
MAGQHEQSDRGPPDLFGTSHGDPNDDRIIRNTINQSSQANQLEKVSENDRESDSDHESPQKKRKLGVEQVSRPTRNTLPRDAQRSVSTSFGESFQLETTTRNCREEPEEHQAFADGANLITPTRHPVPFTRRASEANLSPFPPILSPSEIQRGFTNTPTPLGDIFMTYTAGSGEDMMFRGTSTSKNFSPSDLPTQRNFPNSRSRENRLPGSTGKNFEIYDAGSDSPTPDPNAPVVRSPSTGDENETPPNAQPNPVELRDDEIEEQARNEALIRANWNNQGADTPTPRDNGRVPLNPRRLEEVPLPPRATLPSMNTQNTGPSGAGTATMRNILRGGRGDDDLWSSSTILRLRGGSGKRIDSSSSGWEVPGVNSANEESTSALSADEDRRLHPERWGESVSTSSNSQQPDAVTPQPSLVASDQNGINNGSWASNDQYPAAQTSRPINSGSGWDNVIDHGEDGAAGGNCDVTPSRYAPPAQSNTLVAPETTLSANDDHTINTSPWASNTQASANTASSPPRQAPANTTFNLVEKGSSFAPAATYSVQDARSGGRGWNNSSFRQPARGRNNGTHRQPRGPPSDDNASSFQRRQSPGRGNTRPSVPNSTPDRAPNRSRSPWIPRNQASAANGGNASHAPMQVAESQASAWGSTEAARPGEGWTNSASPVGRHDPDSGRLTPPILYPTNNETPSYGNPATQPYGQSRTIDVISCGGHTSNVPYSDPAPQAGHNAQHETITNHSFWETQPPASENTPPSWNTQPPVRDNANASWESRPHASGNTEVWGQTQLPSNDPVPSSLIHERHEPNSSLIHLGNEEPYHEYIARPWTSHGPSGPSRSQAPHILNERVPHFGQTHPTSPFRAPVRHFQPRYVSQQPNSINIAPAPQQVEMLDATATRPRLTLMLANMREECRPEQWEERTLAQQIGQSIERVLAGGAHGAHFYPRPSPALSRMEIGDLLDQMRVYLAGQYGITDGPPRVFVSVGRPRASLFQNQGQNSQIDLLNTQNITELRSAHREGQSYDIDFTVPGGSRSAILTGGPIPLGSQRDEQGVSELWVVIDRGQPTAPLWQWVSIGFWNIGAGDEQPSDITMHYSDITMDQW